MNKDLILQAVARGWCSKENEHKEMDATLAQAIADEVYKEIIEHEVMKLRSSRMAAADG